MGPFKFLCRWKDDAGSQSNTYHVTAPPSYSYYGNLYAPPISLLAVGASNARNSSEPFVQGLKDLALSGWTNKPKMPLYAFRILLYG